MSTAAANLTPRPEPAKEPAKRMSIDTGARALGGMLLALLAVGFVALQQLSGAGDTPRIEVQQQPTLDGGSQVMAASPSSHALRPVEEPGVGFAGGPLPDSQGPLPAIDSQPLPSVAPWGDLPAENRIGLQPSGTERF